MSTPTALENAAALELRRLHAENVALRAELAKEAARTASEKLRADQMTEQHRMQAAMNTEARAQLASIGASHGQAPAWATKPTEQQILEAAFAPAQPVAEASRFGSPELQAMIVARCVEKDQADSVQDEALIRQMLEALETCNDGDGYNGPYQYYETVPVEEAVAAARARLLEADLAKLTERGAVAWPGIDAQDLRDGSKP